VVPKRTRVIERVVRHPAVRCGAEAWQHNQPKSQRRHVNGQPWADRQKTANLADVFGPVGQDLKLDRPAVRRKYLRFLLTPEPTRKFPGSILQAKSRRNERLGHSVQIRNDILLHPRLDRPSPIERHVEFLATILGNQGEGQQSSSPTIIFGVEEVPQ